MLHALPRHQTGFAAALRSGDAKYDSLPDYFRSRFEPALAMLLTSAANAGVTRGDIAPYDLLRAIGNLSFLSDDDAVMHTEWMISLLIAGLRFGAQQQAS
ncbi:SbtR family transcriptional regulator [Telluria aromaticivorans]|uniref:SbtR family transcriptional regulator n=1 Tax=Telluria aromaticivorans TaxID=2725995 RepID=UPI0035317CF5